MLLDNKEYTFDRVFRLTVSIAAILGFIWLLGYLSDVLIPFAVAFLLAYLLNPLVTLVQRKIKNRLAAVTVTLLGVVLALTLALVVLVPLIMNEVHRMGQLAKTLTTEQTAEQNAEKGAEKTLVERANDLVTTITAHLPESLRPYLENIDLGAQLSELVKQEKVQELAQNLGKKALSGVWGILSGTAGLLLGLMGLIVIALYLVFMLLDYQKLKQEWQDLIPPVYREPILGFVQEFDAGMNRYFRSQAVIAAIVGVLFAIGFTIIGLPMGILLGLFIGLLNMVPYLQIIGLIPALLLGLIKALETKDSSIILTLGSVLLVFIVVQVIQDAFLTPRIMGKVTGLSPAMILLSISVWGKLLGFLGLIIALPMTCLMLAIYKRMTAGMTLAEAVAEGGETPDDDGEAEADGTET